MRRYLPVLLLVLPLAIWAVAVGGTSSPKLVAAEGEVVPGRYIVVLENGRNPYTDSRALGREFGFEADAVYTTAVRGFAASMSAADASDLADDSRVKFVEAEQVVSTALHDNAFQTLPTGVDR